MSKGSTNLICVNSNCKGQIKPGAYYFVHPTCNKKLCFWCVFEVYKNQKHKDPKFSNLKKEKLKISLPCCQSKQSQFSLLQEFIVNRCLFDGKKCKSQEKYQWKDQLTIGQQCYDQFIANYKQTAQNERMRNKISAHTFILCKGCQNNPINITLLKQLLNLYGHQFLGFCQHCVVKIVKKRSQGELKQVKSKYCHKCKQEEILNYSNRKQKNQDEFLVKDFILTQFSQTLRCYFCIYSKWQQFWLVSDNREIDFKKLINYTCQFQFLFLDHCLTCGIQPEQEDKNVFELNDESIQSPFILQVFLCGHCHAIIDQNKKVTKTLHKFKNYLMETGQDYLSIKNSIKFKEFKENVQEWINYFWDILEDKKLLEQQKQIYDLKITSKSGRNINNEIMQRNNKIKQIQKQTKIKLSQNDEKKPELIQKKQNMKSKDLRIFSSKGKVIQTKQNQSKPIVSSKSTQNKQKQIKNSQVEKLLRNQNLQKGNLNLVSQKESSKISGQGQKKFQTRTDNAYNQRKLQQNEKKSQTQSIESQTKSNYQSMTESEQSSVQGLTESRNSLTNQSSNEELTDVKCYVSLDSKLESEGEENDKYTEKQHKFISEYESKQQQQKNQSFQGKTFINSKKSEELTKVQYQKSLSQHYEGDIFDLELIEWKFQEPINQKPIFPNSDFQRKLQSAVNDFQSFLPQLLKDIKTQNNYELVETQKKYLCQECKKTQEEFLFVQKYCFKCFNSYLIEK